MAEEAWVVAVALQKRCHAVQVRWAAVKSLWGMVKCAGCSIKGGDVTGCGWQCGNMRMTVVVTLLMYCFSAGGAAGLRGDAFSVLWDSGVCSA